MSVAHIGRGGMSGIWWLARVDSGGVVQGKVQWDEEGRKGQGGWATGVGC